MANVLSRNNPGNTFVFHTQDGRFLVHWENCPLDSWPILAQLEGSDENNVAKEIDPSLFIEAWNHYDTITINL